MASAQNISTETPCQTIYLCCVHLATKPHTDLHVPVLSGVPNIWYPKARPAQIQFAKAPGYLLHPYPQKKVSYSRLIVANSEFCSFHHYFALNSTKFNFPPHSRPCKETLVFPGQSSRSSASQTPASPITHPLLPQQCRQRTWVLPDNLVVSYTPRWQHRRAPFQTTSGSFNREVLQDHIRWNKKHQFWIPHADSCLSFFPGEVQMQPTTAAFY